MDAARFWSRVGPANENGCREWLKCTTGAGYGAYRWNKKTEYAHRRAYELGVGPIPEGAFVLHDCDNPRCCAPEHLCVGTQKKNMSDAAKRGRLWQPSIFDEDQVVDIIDRISDGESYCSIAREYNTTHETIRRLPDRDFVQKILETRAGV